jgi:hypothetical protein
MGGHILEVRASVLGLEACYRDLGFLWSVSFLQINKGVKRTAVRGFTKRVVSVRSCFQISVLRTTIISDVSGGFPLFLEKILGL